MSSAWEPDQYHRFRAERRQPFDDLLGLIRPVPGGRVVDLGCGTGELTLDLHRHVQAAETIGVDSAEGMLAQARGIEAGGLGFRSGDIALFADTAAWDVVAANAALQWVPGHPELLRRLVGALRPGGQLAVQVPANADHLSHTTSAGLAAGEFREAFVDGPPPDPVLEVLSPEGYAELLDRLGAREQHVRLQVYGHHLESVDDVVEWVKGTSLTRFKSALAPADYERFVARYREELRRVIGDRRPYFYAFKRILLWARF